MTHGDTDCGITLYLLPGVDTRLLPVSASGSRHRAWWQDDPKTQNHAQHCLPLSMANSLGYYILSPATFSVEWNGDSEQDAAIEIERTSPHGNVDAHSAHGSFTVQFGFIPTTNQPGDFLFVK